MQFLRECDGCAQCWRDSPRSNDIRRAACPALGEMASKMLWLGDEKFKFVRRKERGRVMVLLKKVIGGKVD